MEDEVIKLLLEKRYLIFAPKNLKDLRIQYPELLDYAEFSTSQIKTHDLLFVWWFKCVSSPYYDVDDAEKLQPCIDIAYPTEQQRLSRAKDFSFGFPDNIKSAFKRMESFNLIARIENYLYTLRVRENCKAMLGNDVSIMDPEEQESWSKRAPGIWKLMEETSKTLERGGFGVAEYDDTSVNEADGAVRNFRQSNK